MRKTSYVITFFLTVVLLVLNLLSAERPRWLVIKSPVIHGVQTITHFGLMERCERTIMHRGRHRFVDHACRAFPMRVEDHCEQENSRFCILFTSARYATELGIGFSAMALVALLIGISTHTRRRRIWRAVAGLVALHAIFQLITFVLVTTIYQKGLYVPFNKATLSTGYYANGVSWIMAMLTAAGVTITGLAAEKGRQWAAGNRAYHPIDG